MIRADIPPVLVPTYAEDWWAVALLLLPNPVCSLPTSSRGLLGLRALLCLLLLLFLGLRGGLGRVCALRRQIRRGRPCRSRRVRGRGSGEHVGRRAVPVALARGVVVDGGRGHECGEWTRRASESTNSGSPDPLPTRTGTSVYRTTPHCTRVWGIH